MELQPTASRNFSAAYANIPSSAEADRNEPELSGLTVSIEHGEDIYDMVLVAAFGGVTMDLGHNSQMKQQTAVVHPFYIWIASACLFCLQILSIFCLRIDMNVNAHIHLEDEEAAKGRILLIMQIVMILILQVMIYKELLGSLVLLVFAINPTTWMDVKSRAVQGRYGWMRHPAFLVPFPVMSLMFKVIIGYNICTDSLSVILVCRNVQDVIFNSLAITFIADLDEPFWKMISGIFHLDAVAARDWNFELKKPEGPDTSPLPSWLRRLHRRKGGREIENMFTYGVLWWIYVRQLFIVLFALKTDTLPIARDVCSIFRYSHVRILNFFLSQTVFGDVIDGVDRIANDRLEHCTTSYKLIGLTDIFELTRDNPWVSCTGVSLITSLVIGAQVARRVLADRPAAPEDAQLLQADSPEEAASAAPADATRHLDLLKNEVKELREMVAKLHRASGIS